MKNTRFFQFLVLLIVSVTVLFLLTRRHENTRISPSAKTLTSVNASNTAPKTIAETSAPKAELRLSSPSNVSVSNQLELLKAIKTVPPGLLVTNLTAANEAQLIAVYQSTTLSNRTALVWALAGIGGDQTANAFIDTLLKEFAEKKLVADEGGSLGSEEAVMETIVNALGFVASRSDIANAFLLKAIQPAFWQNAVKWESSTGREINGLLASSAIQGLGMANREEAANYLLQLKVNLPVDSTVPPRLRRSFAGDVVQAAFYLNQRAQLGDVGFYKWFLDRERDIFDGDGSYRKWTTTTNGAEWNKWYLSKIE